MIAATVALPVRGPEGAYRFRRSANSAQAAAATVSSPRAAQPAPAAMVAATMPPLGSVSRACIMGLLEGRDGRGCRDGGPPPPPPWPASRPQPALAAATAPAPGGAPPATPRRPPRGGGGGGRRG